MNNAFASFIIGLLCTLLMFVLCVVVVVGVKAIIYAIKERLLANKPQTPPVQEPKLEKQRVKRKRKPKTVPKPVRSIEIDPEQVDRIYVKKIS